MANGTEVELKLAIAPADAAALAETEWVRAATPAAIPLAATYFDTPDGALRRAGYSLRVRTEGGRVVQTVKATGEAAGLFARPEWECELAGDAPRLDAAAGPLGTVLSDETRAALAPAFTTAVQRTEARIARDDGVVMLAVDRGTVSAGDRREELCEAELELKSGSPAALFALARLIDAAAPARLGVLTKAERGYRLAASAGRKATKAEAVLLDPERPAAAGFHAICNSCLRQFRLNEELLAERDDPQALHQARVGLRRLRSAFSLFRPLFGDDPAAARLRGGLRDLQGVLGEARDLDVLVARLGGEHEHAARLQLGRMEAYEAVDAGLAAPATRALFLDLAEWLALGGWRDTEAAREPLADTAAAVLDKHRRRIRKRGRDLAAQSDHDRHQVRIEAKKLRYAAEFLGGLYLGKKARRRHETFVHAVAALQERLGTLNDLATAPRLLDALGISGVPEPEVDRAALIASAAKAWEELVDARRFWR